MTKNINLNLVLILAIALVVAIPVAYSAVEPSIIINMITGQTTNPFQIKDDTGKIVLEIDEDGFISNQHLVILSFDERTETDFVVTCSPCSEDVEGDYLVLAEWNIDFDQTVDEGIEFAPIVVQGIMYGTIKTTDASSFGELSFFFSINNGTSWSAPQMPRIASSVTNFENKVDTQSLSSPVCSRTLPDDNCLFRVMFGTTGSTQPTLTFRDAFAEMHLWLPSGATITRVS